MTRRELYAMTRGREVPYDLDRDRISAGWRTDTQRNPALRQATDDDRLLEFNRQANELARNLLMREDANRAQRKTEFLKAMLNRPGVNLFTPPNTEDEATAQRVVQAHIDAGSRGNLYGQAGARRQKAEAQTGLQNRLRLQDAALDRAKFRKDLEDTAVSRRQQEFANNLAIERENNAVNYRNQNLRLDADRIRAEADRDKQRQSDIDFRQALDAVKTGIAADEAVNLFRLTPENAAVLRSYEDAYVTQENRDIEELENLAQAYSAIEARKRQALSPDAADPTQWEELSGDDAEMILEGARRGLRYDPRIGFYAPERQPVRPPPAPPSPALLYQRDPRNTNNLVEPRGMDEVARLPSGTPFFLNGRVWTKR